MRTEIAIIIGHALRSWYSHLPLRAAALGIVIKRPAALPARITANPGYSGS
jgi:hypothetical protein